MLDEKAAPTPLFRLRDPQWTPRVWSSNSTDPPFSAPQAPVSAALGEGRPRDTSGLGLVPVIFAPSVVMEVPAAHGGPHAASHVKARSCDRRCRPPYAPSLRVWPNPAGCSAPPSGSPPRVREAGLITERKLLCGIARKIGGVLSIYNLTSNVSSLLRPWGFVGRIELLTF